MAITVAQKQALIDNLQLEITERARKLRAQYALQAQGLRTRLEMRVNRIPQAMRKRNIQDLFDEQALKTRPAPPPAVSVPIEAPLSVVESPKRQVYKRKSDQMSTSDNNDKENRPNLEQDDLPVPKKRAKTAMKTTANTKVARTASRKVTAPSNVLSPRSNNSRTLIRSPFKAEAPRAISPAKASSNLGPAKAPNSRAPSRQVGKRGVAAAPAPEHSEGRDSEASNTSAGTTIIRKTTAKKAPVAKKAPSTKPAASGGRKPAVKKDIAAPTVASEGRILRKRG